MRIPEETKLISLVCPLVPPGVPHLFNYQNKLCCLLVGLAGGIRAEDKTCLKYAGKNLELDNKSNGGHQQNRTRIKLITNHDDVWSL